MKKIIVIIGLLPLLAFGQKVGVKMSREAVAQNWAMAGAGSYETPSISGGGLLVESEPNGFGRRVVLVVSKPGSHMLQGRGCSGEMIDLGGIQWDELYGTVSQLVYDSSALTSALPLMPQICEVMVVRILGGQIEKSYVPVNPWQQSSGRVPKIQIGSEGTTSDGKYFLTTSTVLSGATVIMGRTSIATEVRSTIGGSIITFGSDVYLPPGPTTLTVCQANECQTTTFERKVDPASNGKG